MNFALDKNSCFPSGHFHSPIISVAEIKSREEEIWKGLQNDQLAGITLNVGQQVELLAHLCSFYQEMPFQPTKQEKLRYYFENDFYSYSDAIILYGMIRHYKPIRIIEIGSGFSSAVMLDTNEMFFENRLQLTFVDPYPQRLQRVMNNSDRCNCRVVTSNVQQVHLSNFQRLSRNDILFVDSSHVVKTGSDLHFILFEILPLLKSGVLIHFHDIFYPFEYPKDWVFRGFNWNEAYFIRAFLMYNEHFKVRLFSHYLHLHHREAFKEMPLTYKNPGGNLWLEKV